MTNELETTGNPILDLAIELEEILLDDHDDLIDRGAAAVLATELREMIELWIDLDDIEDEE